MSLFTVVIVAPDPRTAEILEAASRWYRLTFRGRQSSPLRLLSMFSAETEVDFFTVDGFFIVSCILCQERVVPPQRA